MKAVIPAAGKGSRLYPYTLSNPKELMHVFDPRNLNRLIAVIDLVIREAYEAGCDDIRIITAPRKSPMEIHLQTQQDHGEIPASANLSFNHQKDPHGLGDAIYCARKFVGIEDFAVLLGDDFYENNPTTALISAFKEKKLGEKIGAILTVQKVSDDLLGRYGVVKVSGSGAIMSVEDIVEKPQSNPPSNYAVTGRYIFSNKIFPYIEKIASCIKDGAEIQLTDAIREMIRDDYKVYALEISGKRYDTGDLDGWSDTIEDLINKRKSEEQKQ